MMSLQLNIREDIMIRVLKKNNRKGFGEMAQWISPQKPHGAGIVTAVLPPQGPRHKGEPQRAFGLAETVCSSGQQKTK